MTESDEDKRADIKPYFKWQLCELYGGIGEKQLNAWLRPFESEIGKRNGKYSQAQIEIIFKHLGRPYLIP